MVQLYLLRRLFITILVLAIVVLSKAAIPIMRGVQMDRLLFYIPGFDKSFLCLDKKKTIKYAQINDDYCDCADGSDEPGTSACPNGYYHCVNIGYRAENIYSSRVNDGVCDCCDGSDEWAENNSKCQNTCLHLRQVEKENQRSKAKVQQRARAKKYEMIARARKIRIEREARRIALIQQLNEQEAFKAEMEEIKRNAEAAEAEALGFNQNQIDYDTAKEKITIEAQAAFSKYDKNEDGLLEINELMQDMILDRNRDGIITVEEAKIFTDCGRLVDLVTFCMELWPKIKAFKLLNDENVKPTIAKNNGEVLKEPLDKNLINEVNNLERPEVCVNGEQKFHEDQESIDKAGDGEMGEIENDPETQRLIDIADDARKVYSDAVQKVRKIEQEILSIDNQVFKDFGANEEFLPLDGKCFQYEDRDYVYDLCPFKQAVQKRRDNAQDIILGYWDQWVGDGDIKYEKQKYANGTECWNGPPRSCLVYFVCGLEEKINSVTEPNRCEYHYILETPAACTGKDEQHHEEL